MMMVALEYAKKVFKSAWDNFPLNAIVLIFGFLAGASAAWAWQREDWWGLVITFLSMTLVMWRLFFAKQSNDRSNNDNPN